MPMALAKRVLAWARQHAPTICLVSGAGTAFGIYERWFAPTSSLQVFGYFVGSISFLIFWWSLYETAVSGRMH